MADGHQPDRPPQPDAPTDMTINSTVSTTQSRRMLGVLASIAAGAALLSGAGTP